jgi:PAS domain S-box-containing protein
MRSQSVSLVIAGTLVSVNALLAAAAMPRFEGYRDSLLLPCAILAFLLSVVIAILMVIVERVRSGSKPDRRLLRAVQATHDGLWEFDLIADLPWVGTRFKEMLGFSDTDLNLTMAEYDAMVHPEDLPRLLQHVDDHVHRGSPFDIEYRLRHRQGHYEWVRSRAQVERDAAGSPVRIAGNIEIITAFKRAEQARIEATLAAEAANRAKSTFLANVSHEIRTPMNGIIGITDMLGETLLDATQQEYVEIVRASARGLLSMINDLLDLSKIEAGRIELLKVEFSLHDLVYETVAASFLQLATRAIEPIVHITGNVPATLSGDPNRLRQIILNYIGNALKFTNEGQVLLKISAPTIADDHALLRIEVSDSGIGISPESIGKLFQPFSQVDASITRNQKGTGLGLALVKNLTSIMGGDAGVVSEVGRGSTFWATVNLQVPRVQPGPAVPRMTNHRVLVVDDVAASRECLRDMLETSGLEVAVASSVDEALNILSGDGVFSAILADELMPGRNGLDLLTAVRTDMRSRKIPFIMMSLLVEHEKPAESAFQADAILQKPLRGLELPRLLDQLINGTSSTTAKHAPKSDALRKFPGARLLVVEDNPVNQRVVRRLLEKMDIAVTVANDGAEAVQLFGTHHYDAVLMDCQMPVMDGLTATLKIRELEAGQRIGTRIPIIALSANVMQEDRERSLAAGMDEHIGKPIVVSQLVDCLAHYLSVDRSAMAV